MADNLKQQKRIDSIEYVAEIIFGYRPEPEFIGCHYPQFDITELMKKLGERGISIHLRYDHLRENKNFTLVSPKGRICDTDTPLEALCQWIMPSNDHRELAEDEIEYGKGLEGLALEYLGNERPQTN